MIWAGRITPYHCDPRTRGTRTGADTHMRMLTGMVSSAATAVDAR